MSAPQPYVVQADTEVTWGGQVIFVRRETVVDIVPGSPMYVAYGGSSGNLVPLSASQAGDAANADHSDLGD